jgi:ADP-ribosylglycohydrolase
MFAKWVRDEINEPYNSFGNGSAMRVSPVGWLSSNLSNTLLIAQMSAEITHDHPEGIKGAKCIAYAIWHLRHGYDKAFIEGKAETNFGYNLDKTCDQIRSFNWFDETCQVTVPQAIICFLESTDFESAIRLAVSIGGDSDTIAAITGSLAEAYYGIPEWMKDEAMERLTSEMRILVRKFYNNVNDQKIK